MRMPSDRRPSSSLTEDVGAMYDEIRKKLLQCIIMGMRINRIDEAEAGKTVAAMHEYIKKCNPDSVLGEIRELTQILEYGVIHSRWPTMSFTFAHVPGEGSQVAHMFGDKR